MEHQHKPKNMVKLVKIAAVAAAMTAALAVSAGAVNAATNGLLFQTIEIWSDGYRTQYEATDEDGNSFHFTAAEGASITVEDDCMLLHAAGETVDITEEMERNGAYHFEKYTDEWSVIVDVIGSTDNWSMTEITNADGISYTTTYNSTEDGMDASAVYISESTNEDLAENEVAVTITETES